MLSVRIRNHQILEQSFKTCWILRIGPGYSLFWMISVSLVLSFIWSQNHIWEADRLSDSPKPIQYNYGVGCTKTKMLIHTQTNTFSSLQDSCEQQQHRDRTEGISSCKAIMTRKRTLKAMEKSFCLMKTECEVHFPTLWSPVPALLPVWNTLPKLRQ